jgi:hypothetical protein
MGVSTNRSQTSKATGQGGWVKSAETATIMVANVVWVKRTTAQATTRLVRPTFRVPTLVLVLTMTCARDRISMFVLEPNLIAGNRLRTASLHDQTLNRACVLTSIATTIDLEHVTLTEGLNARIFDLEMNTRACVTLKTVARELSLTTPAQVHVTLSNGNQTYVAPLTLLRLSVGQCLSPSVPTGARTASE